LLDLEKKIRRYLIINSNKILITLDKEIFAEYEVEYFRLRPKARVFPFRKNKTKKKELLYSVLSLNDLLPMSSEIYGSLKEKWGDFGVWVANRYGMADKLIDNAMIELKVYSQTKAQKDCDNIAGGYKLFGDGFIVKSGMFIDDNYKHINPLLISLDYDKENPRMEIRITVTDEKDIYKKVAIHLETWK